MSLTGIAVSLFSSLLSLFHAARYAQRVVHHPQSYSFNVIRSIFVATEIKKSVVIAVCSVGEQPSLIVVENLEREMLLLMPFVFLLHFIGFAFALSTLVFFSFHHTLIMIRLCVCLSRLALFIEFVDPHLVLLCFSPSLRVFWLFFTHICKKQHLGLYH